LKIGYVPKKGHKPIPSDEALRTLCDHFEFKIEMLEEDDFFMFSCRNK